MKNKPQHSQQMQQILNYRSFESQLPVTKQNQGHGFSHYFWVNEWNIILINSLTELLKHPVEADR